MKSENWKYEKLFEEAKLLGISSRVLFCTGEATILPDDHPLKKIYGITSIMPSEVKIKEL